MLHRFKIALRMLSILTFACFFALQAATAASVDLLRDINTEPEFDLMELGWLGSTTNGMLFTARIAGDFARLYRTDGTAAGTERIGGGAANSIFASEFSQELGSRRLLNATDKLGAGQIWISDGTDVGTFLLASGKANWLAASPTIAYFQIQGSPNSNNLWRTDGTSAGTYDLQVGAVAVGPHWLIGDRLYFVTSPNGIIKSKLRATNGAASGLTDVISLETSGITDIFDLSSLGSKFLACAREANSTALVAIDPATGTYQSLVSGQNALCPDLSSSVSEFGVAYFVWNNRLWRSDGTTAGTSALTPVVSGFNQGPRLPLALTASGVLFAYTDGNDNSALWITGGPNSLAQQIFQPSDNGNMRILATRGGVSIFQSGSSRVNLFRSDGTTMGTRVIPAQSGVQYDLKYISSIVLGETQLYVSAGEFGPYQWWKVDYLGAEISNFTVAGPTSTWKDQLFYSHLGQPWTSNGTVAGTRQLTALGTTNRNEDSNPAQFTNVGDFMVFTARDATNGMELWKSDGTQSGTNLIRDLVPGPDSSLIEDLYAIGQLVYFHASAIPANQAGAGHFSVWRSDGTANGTFGLDIQPYRSLQDSCKSWAAEFRGRTYFFASQNQSPIGLASTDGSVSGTRWEFDVANATDFCNLTATASGLYFSALSVDGRELWHTDGTAAGTVRTKVIVPNGTATYAIDTDAYIVIGNTVYFVADDGSNGPELWKSDGTVSGTSAITDFPGGSQDGMYLAVIPFNGKMILRYEAVFSPQAAPPGLYISDGTAIGTTLIATGGTYRETSAGSRLYFFTTGPNQTESMWVTDGTPAGTRLVLTASSGGGFDINHTIGYDGVLFASGIRNGTSQLLVADGTSSGFRAISRFDSSDIGLVLDAPIHMLKGRAVVVAKDATRGAEPYILRNTNPSALPDNVAVASGMSVLIDVVANDNDPDGMSSNGAPFIVINPSNGTIALDGRSIRYTANTSFAGTDSFQYRFVDEFGAVSSPVSVTIAVTAAPVGGGPDAGGGGGGGRVDIFILQFLLWLIVLQQTRGFEGAGMNWKRKGSTSRLS
jgi:ELWxxDGT repeat protein